MLIKVSGKSKTTLRNRVPVDKIKMTGAGMDYTVHLGPYMPFNSSGLYNPVVHRRDTIKTNSTV